MNSVSEFMSNFRRTWEEKQAYELQILLENGPTYFREIPSDQKALVLSLLFEGHKNLLKFFKIEMDNYRLYKTFRFVLKQGFKFLKFLFVEYSDHFGVYLHEIKKLLTTSLIIQTNNSILKNVHLAFIEFLKMFNKYDIGFTDIFVSILEKRGLCTLDERQYMFRVLSAIVYYFPEDDGAQQYSAEVRRIVLDNFETEFKARVKDKYSRIPIYLESIIDLMETMPFDRKNTADLRFFEKIKILSEEALKANDLILLKLILQLLQKQMFRINKVVYKDHNYWYDFFSRLTDEDECSELAIGALKVYHQVIANILLKNNVPERKELLQSLKSGLLTKLTSEYICAKKLRLFVNGYSCLAPVVERFEGSKEVEEMFSTVVNRIVPFYFSENDVQEYYDDLPDYQEALSRILMHIKDVSTDHLRIVIKISLLLIKRFPELSQNTKNNAIISLNRTFSNVGNHKIQVFHEFVRNIIFDGLMWSCSHCLSIDAELLQELGKLKKQPICYKNYIPLWIGILNPNVYTSEQELEFIIKQFLNTFIELSNKLNLSIVVREDTIFSDVALSKVAKNEDDLRIFINAVDLYDELLVKIDPRLLEDKIDGFLLNIIRASYKNPCVSGFHKMLSCLFNIRDKEKLSSNLSKILIDYIMDTIKEMVHHPIELQISCVNLILNIPITFILPLIEESISAFKIALKIGLNDYSIANTTINTLETYTFYLDDKKVNDFFKSILPDLEIYLRSKESLQIYTEATEKTQTKVQINEESLEKLQRRIALLFGRIDNQVLMEFIHQQSLDTGATWDKKDLLEYSLNFPDMRFNIYLDKLLPKIIEMALYSSDRKTKIAAGESLHSIVAIILGKTIQCLSAEPDRFTPLYEILCPALLKLGCDPDDVTKRLYSPLMLQITHWLSNKLMLHSSATNFLITALFDGLSDETNFSLRDFSGICLAEFAKWGIKQSNDQDLAQIPVIIDNIVENIINFALHPSKQRKIAASIAFNYLWKILAENDEIVDAFWMEFLFVFIKSMNGLNDINISKSLDNIKRVFKFKSRIFNDQSQRRRIPVEFNRSGKLEDALNWLLCQCGSLDKNVRNKSMELVEDLSVQVNEVSTPKNFIQTFIELKGVNSFNDIILNELTNEVGSLSCNYLKSFVKSLQCFIWIIQRQLVDKNSLFNHLNAKNGIIFNSIDNFITLITREDDEMNNTNLIEDSNHLIYDSLKSESLMAVINFTSELIQIDIPEKDIIHEKIINKNLFKLISHAIFQPEIFGYNLQNLESIDQLKNRLEAFLNLLMSKLQPDQLNLIKAELNNQTFDLENDSDLNMIKSLFLLSKCGIFEGFNSTELLNKIFSVIKIGENDSASCVDLSSNTKVYFECLLTMILYKNPSTMKMLIKNYLTNENELIQSNCSKVSHGEYFFYIFQDVIVNCLVEDLTGMIEILEEMLAEHSNLAFFLLEQITLWIFKNKNKLQSITEEFSDKIIRKFNIFLQKVNDSKEKQKSLINIYKTVVRIKNNPLEIAAERGELYCWILNELIEAKELLKLSEILNNFLICLVGEDSNNIVELEVILNNLKNYINFDISLENNNYLTTKAMECFQILIKLLPLTKSYVVLKVTTIFAAGHANVLCNEATNSSLQKYFTSIRNETAVKSLQIVYRLFLDKILDTERFDILKYFLLPSIQFCNPIVVEQFFINNITEIFQLVWQEVMEDRAGWKKLIISKIGCYNLLQLMYLMIDQSKIDAADGIFATTLEEMIGKKVSKVTISILSKNQRTRGLTTEYEDQKELMRQFHCALFNCTTTITCLSDEKRLYLILCQEGNEQNNLLIWERIIDCSKKYELSQTFKEFPKHKKRLVNIKNVMKTTNSTSVVDYSYMNSYNLAGSTLNEDILAYDFGEFKILPKPSTSTISIVLESDDFNDHECMDTICGFLKVLFDRNLHTSEDGSVSVLETFANSMYNKHKNVQLFTLKVILNNHSLLKSASKLFIPIVLNALGILLYEEPLNYIVTDALLMLIDWNFIPDAETKDIVNSIFTLLIKKIDDRESTEYIVKYNFSIVELLAGLWHEWLNLPQSFKSFMKTSPSRAVKLIQIFLSNKMEKLIIDNDELNIPDFLSTIYTKSFEKGEDLMLNICQAIGLFLKYSESTDNFDGMKEQMVIVIQNILRLYQRKNYDRLVKCVHVFVKAYPKLCNDLYIHISSNYTKVSPRTLVKCFEVFLVRLKDLNDEAEIIRQLNSMNLMKTLRNKLPICEKSCLEVIDALATKLTSENLYLLVQVAAPYADHESLELRQLTYSICMKIYQKFSEYYNPPEKLLELSKNVLISGFVDISDELQQKIIKFWTEEINLSDSPIERVLDIFDIYSSDVEKDFLPIFTTIILHSLKKSPMYKQKMFEPLDKSCDYRNYEIAVSHRVKNLSYQIPLFTSSLSKSFSQRYSLSSLTADDLVSSNNELMLRATGLSEFDDGLMSEVGEDRVTTKPLSILSQLQNDGFVMPQVPLKDRLSRRFLKNYKPLITDEFTSQKLRLRERKLQADKQKNSVKLSRAYRSGDLPDIEITPESVLKPLEELIKKDHLICKNLAVSIICSLIDQLKNDHNSRQQYENIIEKFKEKIDSILKKSREKNFFILAILEILFYNEDIHFDSQVVNNVSRSMGFNNLGALLIERSLIFDADNDDQPRSSKHMRLDPNTPDERNDQWIQLVQLYTSIDNIDAAKNVFQNHLTDFESLESATIAKSSERWDLAYRNYKKALESSNKLIKDHCFDEMCDSLARLSDWTQLLPNINEKYCPEGDLTSFLANATSPEERSAAKLFVQACTYSCLSRNEETIDTCKRFLAVIQSALKDSGNSKYMKEYYAEEVAVLCPLKDNEISKDFINAGLDKIVQNWIQLSPLSPALRAREIVKMQGMYNIQMYQQSAIDESIQPLMKYWMNNTPNLRDDLLHWDRFSNYRYNFSEQLAEKYTPENNIDISSQIVYSNIKLKLKFLDVAYQRGNKSILKKLLESLHDDISKDNNINSEDRGIMYQHYEKIQRLSTDSTTDLLMKEFSHQFSFNFVKFKILKAKYETNSDAKSKHYATGWKKILKVFNKDNVSDDIKLTAKHCICDIISTLINDEEKSTLTSTFNAMKNDISQYMSDNSSEIDVLNNIKFHYLKDCCKYTVFSAKENEKTADCYLKLAKHCYDCILNGQKDDKMTQEFVKSTLKAVICGSREAEKYFPCLLNSEILENSETREVFTTLSNEIVTWKFLKWQAQILHHLTTPLSLTVTPIVEKLVKEYPNAVIYTLRLILSVNPDFSNNPTVVKLCQDILNQPELNHFIEALEFVAQPELLLIYYLNEIIKNRNEERIHSTIDHLIKKVFIDSFKQGDLYRCIHDYRQRIESFKLLSNIEDLEANVNEMKKELYQKMNKRRDKSHLKAYSPWLSQLNGSNIEIPGQYSGNGKPIPEYHAKIMKIESRVQVMKSIRKPIKITIIGNNARNYNFLVKFGEDLRLDERVEQAFTIMNEILHADLECNRRHLSINTYQVTSISNMFGLIQWIDNTKTIHDYVYFNLSNFQRVQHYASIRKDYEDWIKKASPNQSLAVQYKEALIKYDSQATKNKISELIGRVGWDFLRNTFLTLSPSLESFVSLRKNFIRSYATMCTAQWILGIGDRHPENTLVNFQSGETIGIDFASAFDGGIDQSVPELIPFRLTNQILGLMKPFNQYDEFKTVMTHVLTALRREKGSLLAYLSVVANENLNWIAHAQALSDKTQINRQDVNWLPDRKIQLVSQKLDGHKPSELILNELKMKYRDTKYIERYSAILKGSDCHFATGFARRTQFNDKDLSPEDQVVCLIDLATDLNVLGRTLAGWSPWL